MKFGTPATLCAIAFLASSVIAHAGDEPLPTPFGASNQPPTTTYRAAGAGQDFRLSAPPTGSLSPANQILVVLDKQQVRVIAPGKRAKSFSDGQIPDGAILVSCDEVQFPSTTEPAADGDDPAAAEHSRSLRFSGHVMLQTTTFHARADTVAYKGQWLTLSGNAQLEMGKGKDESRKFKVSAESIRFHSHSRRMEINNDIDLEQIPNASFEPIPDSKFE